MTNIVVLLGRPTAEIELKKTNTGKSVCSFTLASNRRFAKDTTNWIPCVAWEKTAETLVNYVRKGQLIVVTGELQSRQYTDNDNNKRTALEVLVNSFDFCEKKSDNTPSVPEYPQFAASNDDNFEEMSAEDVLPF